MQAHYGGMTRATGNRQLITLCSKGTNREDRVEVDCISFGPGSAVPQR
jgi:hypothetical protein